MGAVFDAVRTALHGRRSPSRRASAILAGLLALFVLGALQPAHGTPSMRVDRVVVLDDLSTDATAFAVRSARLLPAHLPSAPLLPAIAARPVLLAPSLLLAIWTPVWLLSRRSRQAHLLASAGPGPPFHS
jgi:hypothetical protein